MASEEVLCARAADARAMEEAHIARTETRAAEMAAGAAGTIAPSPEAKRQRMVILRGEVAAKRAADAEVKAQAEAEKAHVTAMAAEVRIAHAAEAEARAMQEALARVAEARAAQEAKVGRATEEAHAAEEARAAHHAEEARIAEETKALGEAHAARHAEEARVAEEAQAAGEAKAEEACVTEEATAARAAEEATALGEAHAARRVEEARAEEEAQAAGEGHATEEATAACAAEEKELAALEAELAETTLPGEEPAASTVEPLGTARPAAADYAAGGKTKQDGVSDAWTAEEEEELARLSVEQSAVDACGEVDDAGLSDVKRARYSGQPLGR